MNLNLHDLVLQVAFRHRITEPDLGAGLSRFREIVASDVDEEDFQAAIAKALALGQIFEPVRLVDGALQCHWCLEVTPKGADAARRLPGWLKGRNPS